MERRKFVQTMSAATILAGTGSSHGRQNIYTIKDLQPIILPEPEKDGGKSLLASIQARKTNRSISPKNLPRQIVSNLLWAAFGVNRERASFNKPGRTAPSASNSQEIDLYVAMSEGVYLYDVAKHELTLVVKGDFRKESGMQDFVYIAPVNLVYVLNLKNWQDMSRPIPEQKRDRWIAVELGCIAQNVHLYCASEGLGATIRGMIDENKFSEVIKVKPEQILLAQTVGCPK